MVTKLLNKSAKKFHLVSKLDFEQAAWRSGELVCGVDEVGRGCLAGPVVAAAVIIPMGALIDGVRDSKKMGKEELVLVAQKLRQVSWWGVGICDNYLIDSCNIRVATILAMRQAVANLLAVCHKSPTKILVDAMPLQQYFSPEIEVISAPKGEDWSYSIAAASIIAKVQRDQLLGFYQEIFQKSGLGQHKGYGTESHYQYLSSIGQTIVHRKTFLQKFYQAQGDRQCQIFI